jgi:hypothetical protein
MWIIHANMKMEKTLILKEVLGRLMKEISDIRPEVNKKDEGTLCNNEAFK